MKTFDKPLAAAPYKSYRYHGPYGGISIGAFDDNEALNEVKRSLCNGDALDIGLLERWNGKQWVACTK